MRTLVIRHRVALGLLVLVLAPSGLVAQVHAKAHPGRYLQPVTDTIAVTVETQGRVIPFATAVRSVRHVTFGKRPAVQLTYQWRGNDGSTTADTLWIAAATLLPIENRRHNGMQDARTTFDGSSARTRYTPRGKTEQRADTTVVGLLYASGELEELIRTAPLGLGYSAAYTLYYGPPGKLARPATFKVVRSETILGRNGKPVECWVVDAPLSEGLNTFFVSKGDRRVVRLVNHEDPSAAFVFSK